MLRAQSTTPVLGTVSGVSNALAINSNNSAGQAYNAVLNTDSSVSLLGNGAILSGQGCPAFSSLSGGISSGAVYVDSAHNNIYLAILSGVTLYAAYETIGLGTCTQGPLLQLTTNALSNLEMNVDPVQGNVYILNSFGAFPDALYILPIASWSASSATELNMDYSAQYGPIVIDPSNDMVYINDLGGSAYGTVGTYSTSGFFVYDPNQSTTPASNLQHVVGYNTSGGTTPTPFYVGRLLSNGAGELVLVNENPNASSANLSVPITILNTTAPQSLFFTNTSNPYTNNSDVDITPGAALSTISATAQYEAIGGADIDAVNQVVYADAFNIPNSTQPGLLLEYNLSPGASTPETVLSSAAANPNLYGSLAPWSGLNYNPESTELVLSVASEYGSSALGLTSPLCAGTPLSLTQLFGSAVAPTSLGYPVVNATSGYLYAIVSGGIDYVALPPGCATSPPIQISPTTLFLAFPDESYFQNFTATGGSGTGYVWSITSGRAALTNLGLSFSSGGDLSGYPNAPGSYPFTVQVVDSLGNSATQNYTLTIYPDFSVLPTSLPAGTVGTPYSQTFTASGGSGGPYSFSVFSGTALSNVGLTLSSGGLISGTPSATETAAPLTVKIADSLRDFTQLNYTLTINSASSGPITVNDPETVTVNDSLTQVQLVDVSDPETITVTDIPQVTVTQNVSPFAATLVLLASPSSSTTVNALVTFTATLTGPGISFTPTAPSGSVAFTANGGTITGCGAVPVNSVGMATCPTSSLVAPSDAIKATYSGDPNFTVAAPATMTQTVNAFAATLGLTSPGASNVNASVTFTAQLSGISFTPIAPSGVVNFTANGTTISGCGSVAVNASGAATCTTSSLVAPSDAMKANYSGDPNFTVAAPATMTQTVNAPSLEITANPDTLTIIQGQTGKTTLTFTPSGGYTGTLTLGCSGLPANTLCVFELNGAPPPITTVTLPGNNLPVSVTLSIDTDVNGLLARMGTAPAPLPPDAILPAIAFWWSGSLLGLAVFRRKRKMSAKNQRWFGLCLLALLTGAVAAGLAGCGGSGGFGTYVTPVGSSTVTVSVTSASGTVQTLSIGVTITQ
jgi:hypothetical protein